VNKEEQQYLELVKELVDKAESKGFRDVRDGHKRVSVFGRQMRFDLSKGFPLFTHKKVFLRGVFEELMWFLRGQTDNKILMDKNVHIWDLWNDSLKDYGYPYGDLGAIYGESWRDFGAVDGYKPYFNYNGDYVPERSTRTIVKGFDQIEWVVNEIKTNPTSSRLIVNSWNPHVHCVDGKAALPPCHVLFQFFVDGNKLSCQLYQRSSDTPTGASFNVAGYSLLTHLIAQQCDLEVGEFVWTIGDAHIYGDQLEVAKEILKRDTYNFPTIKINKAKDLYSYEWEDIEILDYVSGDKISIPVAK